MSVKQLLGMTLTDVEADQSLNPADLNAVKFFVGVRPAVMPENRFLEYAVIDRALELAEVKPRTVILFESSDEQVRLAHLICQNQREIGVSLVHLDGIPGSELTAALRDAFFNLPVASHAAFISEIALDIEIDEQKKMSSQRTIDREESRRTRSDGSVKDVEIGVVSPTSEEDE